MARLTIRNLDDLSKTRLRAQAAANRRSMSEEARNILRAALYSEEPIPGNLAEAIRARFEPHGGVDLTPLPREPIRETLSFD